MGTVACFVDTDVLLHFQTFDEVDWPRLMSAESVEIVLAPTVMQELNRHKDDASNQWRHDRARMLVSKLRHLLAGVEPGQLAPVRPNVTLLDIATEPHVEWGHLGLDPAVSDDRLIASVLERGAEPGERVVLATNDFLTQRKAARFRIAVLNPEGVIPRVEQASPAAAKVAQLERQLREARFRRPELELSFLDAEQRTKVLKVETEPPRPGWKTDETIRELLDKRRQYLSEVTALGIRQANEEVIERYSRACERHVADLGRHFEGERSRRYGGKYCFTFVLDNGGTEPALDVVVDIEFPKGSVVLGLDDLGGHLWDHFDEPHPPHPPWPRRSGSWDSLGDYQLLPQPRPPEAPRPRGPLYDDEDRASVQFTHPKLRHKEEWVLGPLVVFLPPTFQGSGFGVPYMIRADNIDPKDGRLDLVLTTAVPGREGWPARRRSG